MSYYQEHVPSFNSKHGEFSYDVGFIIVKDYAVNNNINLNYSFGYALSNITKEKIDFNYDGEGLEWEPPESDWDEYSGDDFFYRK